MNIHRFLYLISPRGISDTYYDIKGQVKRFFFYGWKFRKNYHFNADGLYQMMHVKLQACYDEFLVNHHCMWNRNKNTPGMRKLKEMVELSRRLSVDYYQDKHINEVLDKYPDFFDTELVEALSGSFRVTFPKDTPEKRAFSKRIRVKYDNMRKDDKERLFSLLHKHLERFWD